MDQTSDRIEILSEFAGQYPDIPLAPGVDLAALQQDDPNPFFVTLPVSRVDVTSKNGLLYDRATNEAIVEQINAKRPEGGLGHIKEEDIATAYDLPAWRAVGAELVNDTVWGKFYVPPSRQDVREYFRTSMRTNARAGVSLWGEASTDKNRRVKTITVKRVDIADPERVGLPVAARPFITANMAGEPVPAEHEENAMGDELTTLQTRVGEMEARIKELEPLEARVLRLSEMATSLGVTEDDLPARVAEMVTQLNAYRQTERRATVEAAIAAAVELAELRPVVIANMGPVDTWPVENEAIVTAVNAILAKPEIKVLAEMVVKAKGGPAVALGATDNRTRVETDIDAEGRKEAARLGLLRK